VDYSGIFTLFLLEKGLDVYLLNSSLFNVLFNYVYDKLIFFYILDASYLNINKTLFYSLFLLKITLNCLV